MKALTKIPKTSSEDGIVLLVEQGLELLTMANDVDQVKQIRAQGIAYRAAARELDASKTARVQIDLLVLRAEARLGELTAAMPTAKRGPSKEFSSDSKENSKAEQLADNGITWKQASEYEALASMPEPELQQHIDDLKAEGKPITRGRVLARSKGKPTASSNLQRCLQLVDKLSPAELVTLRDALRSKLQPQPKLEVVQ